MIPLARRGLILCLVAFCGIVVLSTAMSQAAGLTPGAAGGDPAGTPPTSTPPRKVCDEASRACMTLSVIEPPGVCIESTCTLDYNESFMLAVDVERPPKEGFILAQSRVDIGPHLAYKPIPTPADEVVLPECDVRVHIFNEGAHMVGHGCITGIPPTAFEDAARLIEFELTCSQGSTSTLIELLAGSRTETLMTTSGGIQLEPDLTHVTVNCVAPGPGTPTPTNTRTSTPTEEPGPSVTPGGPDTPTPTPSHTPGPSLTPGGPNTATPTSSATPTGTLTPATVTPAGTLTPTATGTPATPTDTATSTSVPTNTPTQRPSLLGDVNCDGSVDPVDAVFLLQLEAALIDELPCPDAGDVDEDGQTTLIDAALILQFSAGLVDSLPP